MHSVISCAAGRREPDIGVARRRIADMFAPSLSGKPIASDLVWVAFTSLTGEISRSRAARRCCGDRIFCCQDESCRHSFHLPSTRTGRHPFGRWDYPKRQHTAHPPISPCPWATICGVSFSLRGYWCKTVCHTDTNKYAPVPGRGWVHVLNIQTPPWWEVLLRTSSPSPS